MIAAPFAHGRSSIHGLDPRLRVLGAGALSGGVAVARDFKTLLAAVILALFLAALARLDFREVLRRLFAPFLFLLLLWAVLPWTFEGETLASFGPVDFTREGVGLCARISLKTLSLMVIFMALVATMTLDTLGHALNRMGLPDKLVYLLMITYRYIFVIEQEYQRLWRAMKIRNFRPQTNVHTYRTYAWLAGMLLVRASERAHRVHCAMVCRGFNGRFVSLREFPPHPGNRVFLLGISAALALLILLEWVK
jgi:cobalt/nickel transport system permease protein